MHFRRGGAECLPFDARVGIEIEDDPVGMLEVAGRRSPRMQLEHIELAELRNDTRVGKRDVRLRLAALAIDDFD